ncbi:MAG TPA: ribosome maturation factor RimP [Gemmatimonadaceae bacterium]|nr:ribosome maturation factor RimP [Gemmatimonadaceae bacterium]
MNDLLEDVVRKEVEGLGYELVELRRGGTRGRPLVDVRIDRLDGEQVTVDDCARVSRAIEPRLDAGDVVGTRYVLEVSSPGVERPLRGAADWKRFVGRKANVVSDDVGGRAEVEIVGVEEDVAIVRMPKGDERRVPLAGVREARLAFHWNR